MMLVADGMGGAAAGDFASAVAVRHLRRLADDPQTGSEALKSWKEAIFEVNGELGDMITTNPSLDGMGTTICGGVFDGDEMHIAHIGDSRCYVLAEGNLHRLTHDHSYVQSLVDDGKLHEDAAMNHPHRSLLLKVLNGQPEIKPDFFTTQLAAGDRVMFCSDGLCGLVDDSTICTAMSLSELTDAMITLVELAHAAGGSDNITIIIADVVEVKTLQSPGEPKADTGEHTIVFTPDPSLLAEQESLPLQGFATTGLLGAAADPKVISRIKAAITPGDQPTNNATDDIDEHETITLRERRRYSPSFKRRRWIPWLIAFLIVLGLTGAAWGLRTYVLNQYYISNENDVVAIYQGLPGDIAGIKTSWLYEATDIHLEDLPYSWRNRVVSVIPIKTGGLNQAYIAVHELQNKADQCVEARTTRPASAPIPSDGC
jgi:protein phosphatase